jgi:hypothetical protein
VGTPLPARFPGWQLAEWLGEAAPYRVQHLLDRARWDADAARDQLHGYVLEELSSPDAVLIVDETGFLKKGEHSVEVKRQSTGTARRIENSQVGVFLCYASDKGASLVDRHITLAMLAHAVLVILRARGENHSRRAGAAQRARTAPPAYAPALAQMARH